MGRKLKTKAKELTQNDVDEVFKAQIEIAFLRGKMESTKHVETILEYCIKQLNFVLQSYQREDDRLYVQMKELDKTQKMFLIKKK